MFSPKAAYVDGLNDVRTKAEAFHHPSTRFGNPWEQDKYPSSR